MAEQSQGELVVLLSVTGLFLAKSLLFLYFQDCFVYYDNCLFFSVLEVNLKTRVVGNYDEELLLLVGFCSVAWEWILFVMCCRD